MAAPPSQKRAQNRHGGIVCLSYIAKPILTMSVFQVKKTLEADIWDNGQAETEFFGIVCFFAFSCFTSRWDVGDKLLKCSKLSDAFRLEDLLTDIARREHLKLGPNRQMQDLWRNKNGPFLLKFGSCAAEVCPLSRSSWFGETNWFWKPTKPCRLEPGTRREILDHTKEIEGPIPAMMWFYNVLCARS